MNELRAELEAETRRMKASMGGIDPLVCVAAAKRITEIREALRDNTTPAYLLAMGENDARMEAELEAEG